MAFQPGATLYTQGFGSRAENVEVPHIDVRDPSFTDTQYPIGKVWLNTVTMRQFILYKFQFVNGVTEGIWESASAAAGDVSSLSDNNDTLVFPDSNGNIKLSDGAPYQVVTLSDPGSNEIELSLSNGISLGDYALTTPPPGGMLIPGQVSIGTNTPGISALTVGNGTGELYNFLAVGTKTVKNSGNNQYVFVDNSLLNPTGGAGFCVGFDSSTNFRANAAETIDNAFCFISIPIISANAGTITRAGGFYFNAFGITGNAPVNTYGGYFSNPTGGTNSNTAIFSQNLSVGYVDTTPPTDGAIISGKLAIGTNSAGDAAVTVLASQGVPYYVQSVGTQTLKDSSNNQIVFFDDTLLNPTGGANFCVGFDANTDFRANVAETIDNAFCFFSLATVNTNAGTITRIGNYYSAAVNFSGTAPVNTYGGLFLTSTAGSNSNVAIYSDNLSVGYIDRTPPAAGAIISGKVGIGTNNPQASASLDVASVTTGFLPPRMTTVQKNAIAAPANGLIVFDITLAKLSYFDGATWVNL